MSVYLYVCICIEGERGREGERARGRETARSQQNLYNILTKPLQNPQSNPRGAQRKSQESKASDDRLEALNLGLPVVAHEGFWGFTGLGLRLSLIRGAVAWG